MTETEAIQFVNAEIRPRYRTLNDTQFGDWVAGIRAAEYGQARRIVREIVQDSEATLTLKQFVRRLRILCRPQRQAQAQPPMYDPYVRCLVAPAQHPEWLDWEWFVSPQFARANCGNKQYVSDYAAAVAGETQDREGGRWCGEVREGSVGIRPGTQVASRAERREVDAHILSGPDSAGRRFLLRLREQATVKQSLLPAVKTIPPEPPPIRTASRDLIDRLKKPPLKLTGEPVQVDFDAPEMQMEREPWEQG